MKKWDNNEDGLATKEMVGQQWGSGTTMNLAGQQWRSGTTLKEWDNSDGVGQQ